MDTLQLNLLELDFTSFLIGVALSTFALVIFFLVLSSRRKGAWRAKEQTYQQAIDLQTQQSELEAASFNQQRLWLEEQLGHQKNSVKSLEAELHELQQQLSTSQTLAARLSERCVYVERLEEKVAELEGQNSRLGESLADKEKLLAALRSQRASEQLAHKEKIALLENAREQLKNEFEAVASQLFTKNSEQFNQTSQQGLGLILSPLKDQLSEFKKKVEDSYDKEAQDRRALSEQINHLRQLNQQMSDDAHNLTQALKGENKTQGNWGEVILERVLEASGLRRGKEFEVQVSLTSDQRRYQPDVIVRLPEQKDVIVDAKVSLTAYERYCNAENEQERLVSLRRHALSVKGHVKGLSEKSYQQLEGVRSLDFVLLFIPIEGAFHSAIEADDELFRYAFDQNIIIVSPATLLVTLRTIHNIWRYEDQGQNARDIARRGGELHDKFVGFVDALNEVGDALDKAQTAHSTALSRLSSGRGNLVRQAVMLKDLGVSGKKSLSPELINRAFDEETENR